jgi:hypothetical protein
MLDSERYRGHAAECLVVALETTDPHFRQIHLTLAAAWLTLARDHVAVSKLLTGRDIESAGAPTNVVPLRFASGLAKRARAGTGE